MEGESKCSRKKVIILKHFDFHAPLHYHSEGVCSQLNYLKFHILQFQVKISFVFFKQNQLSYKLLQQSCSNWPFSFQFVVVFSTLCQVEAVEVDHVEDLEGSHVSLEFYRCIVETTRMKRSNLTRLSQKWILNTIAGRWCLKVRAGEDTKDGSCLKLSNAIKQRLEWEVAA